MRKSIIVWVMGLLLLGSCSGGGSSVDKEASPQIKHTVNYNIVVVPDLSNRLDNRLYPRQLTDASVFRAILKVFPDLTAAYNRIAYQKDKLSVRLLNPLEVRGFNQLQQRLTIDLGGFSQRERIEFLRNRENAAKGTYTEKAADFEQAATELYQAAANNHYGADLWNFFNQTLDGQFFTLTKPINTARVKDVSRNILILITDGYIEVGTGGRNPCGTRLCQQLTYYQMKALRRYCQSSNLPLKDAFKESGYGITPIQSSVLEDTEVLMLEVYDRSKSRSGSIRHTPSDFKLLQLYWQDFFEKSGAKRFQLVETRSSEADLEQAIRAFLVPPPT